MIAGLRHLIRRRAERLVWPGGRAAILLYHRVADEPSDPYGLCVTPAQFEEHLQAICDIGRPMSVRDLARSVREGAIPEGAIGVTFDDGYLDNFETALPLLARYDVPATIFVTTGPVGRDREFWWDELERVFFQPSRLPETLELRIEGVLHRWTLGADAVYSQTDVERNRRWHLSAAEAPTARHAAFQELYFLIKPLAEDERTAALNELLGWAGYDARDVRASRRAMTPAQVAELASGGLIEIEAHTVSHPFLPKQPADVQQAEITTSKQTLEEWVGQPVHGFAYPYGAYDDRSVAAVREAGFDFACSGIYRSAWSRSAPLLLPRIEVPSGDGEPLMELLQWQLR